MKSRRETFRLALGGTAALSSVGGVASAAGRSQPRSDSPTPDPRWAKGVEGQRKADLGNGLYLNPVLSGDYPDPTVLKDGSDYYLTHSSFDAAPGLLIWHSRDLVNWRPVGPALKRPLGTVFAPDLVKHDGQYFIYIPFMKAPWSIALKDFANIYVIHAPSIEGPWSEPVDLGVGGLIDPGHVVGEDGHRYLFFNDGKRVRLADDGLSTAGPVETAYQAWRYPDDWITEAWSPEGPKLFRRGDYFYLVNAVGGTSGPATGHMIVAARARSIHGPWEHCPHNPIQRSQSDRDLWWSRGHATCVEGPDGRWHMVYHGYERDFLTLGRQTLLEPIEWGADGWFRATGGDLSRPLPKPKGPAVAHGMARSDDFTRNKLEPLWSLYVSTPDAGGAVAFSRGNIVLKAKGSGPADAAVLTQQVGDRAYEIQVDLELTGDATGGLLLYFNDRLYLGMGIDGQRMTSYRGGRRSYWPEPAPPVRRMQMKIVNDRNIVTFYYRTDDTDWVRHGVRSYVAGYNANTVDDLLSLRPALFASGTGSVTFRDFRYKAL